MSRSLVQRVRVVEAAADEHTARVRADERRLLEQAITQFIVEAGAVGEVVTRADAIKYLTPEIPEISQLAD